MRFATILLLGVSLSTAAEFQVTFAPAARSTPVDGRLIVVVSKELEGEPRFQVRYGIGTQQIFGMDVDAWKPGDVSRMSGDVAGSPLPHLRDLPPGTYSVQAVLNVYETFHRADGSVIKLHMDQGKGSSGTARPVISTANRSASKSPRIQTSPSS